MVFSQGVVLAYKVKAFDYFLALCCLWLLRLVRLVVCFGEHVIMLIEVHLKSPSSSLVSRPHCLVCGHNSSQRGFGIHHSFPFSVIIVGGSRPSTHLAQWLLFNQRL